MSIADPRSMKEICADVERHGRAVSDNPPSLTEWAAGRDQAVPNKLWISTLRKIAWPVRTVHATLPAATSRGLPAVQPVTVVPGSWLRALARLVGVPYTDACRWEVPGESRKPGREKVLDPAARNRTIRLTDVEYREVMDFVKNIRTKPKES